MKTQRRWLKSVIAASQQAEVALPWQRAARRKPATLRSQQEKPKRSVALAAC